MSAIRGDNIQGYKLIKENIPGYNVGRKKNYMSK